MADYISACSAMTSSTYEPPFAAERQWKISNNGFAMQSQSNHGATASPMESCQPSVVCPNLVAKTKVLALLYANTNRNTAEKSTNSVCNN